MNPAHDAGGGGGGESMWEGVLEKACFRCCSLDYFPESPIALK